MFNNARATILNKHKVYHVADVEKVTARRKIAHPQHGFLLAALDAHDL